MTRYSEYRLGVFLSCPRRYCYYYVERMKTPRSVSTPMLLGGNVHEACKLFYDATRIDRTEESLHALFRAIWKRNQTGRFFKTKDEEKEAGVLGLKMLTNFYNRFGVKKPVIIEAHMENRFTSFILDGRVDRVDLSDDGAYEIVDYKTNRFRETEGRERDKQTMQLNVYALLLNGTRPVSLGRYYYMNEDVFDTIEFTPEKIARVREYIFELVEEIEREREFAPSIGKQCTWCDFKSRCVKDFKIDITEPSAAGLLPDDEGETAP
ncbi:MAG: PD-(D/E)XK nuclease family protein [Spirochaetes bacterium]|nr:PD-(D/E)XK nuclease family protein [Spirochaetota bacterium]